MKPCIYICFSTLLFTFFSAESQRISKADKAILANLQSEMQTLSADTADGRAMGSAGEKATGDFMISGLSAAGARPKGDSNGWLQTFTLDDGRQPDNSAFTVDGHALTLTKEWFPLNLCPAGEVSGSPAIALQESGAPWFVDLKEILENAAGNSAFDLAAEVRAKAAACAKKGATALILYNSSHLPDKLSFDPKDKPEPAAIPVVYITREAKRKYLRDESASVDIKVRVEYKEKTRTGHNVVGFVGNGAATTVIVASRYDNNSGLAVMIELAKMLEVSKLKNNNFLYLILSGRGPEWPGGSFYSSHPAVDRSKVNYVVELDRFGASGAAAPTIAIDGLNSSAAWGAVTGALRKKKLLPFVADSGAAKPGNHSFFYRDRIPLLVLSTGHGDDEKDPPNFAEQLNVVKFIYSLIEAADAKGKLAFTP